MVVGGRELIDTLWNVNEMPISYAVGYARINRYIMECKYSCNCRCEKGNYELIDTLWNVNKIRMCIFGKAFAN